MLVGVILVDGTGHRLNRNHLTSEECHFKDDTHGPVVLSVPKCQSTNEDDNDDYDDDDGDDDPNNGKIIDKASEI